MSWYVADFGGEMLVSGAPTRKQALRMYDQRHGGPPVKSRHSYGPGDYEYVFGYPGEESTQSVWVFRTGTKMAIQMGVS